MGAGVEVKWRIARVVRRLEEKVESREAGWKMDRS